MPDPIVNPFELKEAEIRQMVGEITPDELRCVKAVLNGIKARVHDVQVHNPMKHDANCWAWGPAHYLCAYERIAAINRERPAMTHADIVDLSARLDLEFDDVRDVVRATEQHHLIGGTR